MKKRQTANHQDILRELCVAYPMELEPVQIYIAISIDQPDRST